MAVHQKREGRAAWSQLMRNMRICVCVCVKRAPWLDVWTEKLLGLPCEMPRRAAAVYIGTTYICYSLVPRAQPQKTDSDILYGSYIAGGHIFR